MNHIGLDQTEDDILNFEVSDEALETAGGTGKEKAVPPTATFALICIPFGE